MIVDNTSAPAKSKKEVQKIAEQHIGLVKRIASRYNYPDEEFGDLVSIGTIGLMKAVERFDESLGNAFSTYAFPYIRGEISNYISRAKGALIRHKGGEKRQYVGSLDAPLGFDSSGTLLDVIADQPHPIDDTHDEELERLRYLLSQLEPRYRDVLTMTKINRLNRKEAAEWLEIGPSTLNHLSSVAGKQFQQLINQREKFKLKTYKRNRDALPYRDDQDVLHIPEYKLHCEVCNRIFGMWKRDYRTAQSKLPKTCSSLCARKLSYDLIPSRQAWHDQEIALLKSLVGKMPLPKIFEKFHATSRQKGWAPRTDIALKLKVTRLAKSVRCIEDGWNMYDIARLLDVPYDRVRIWKKRGLKVEKVSGGTRCVIWRKDLREFCTEQYWRFAGVDVDKLTDVLQDRALAEKCASQPLKIKTRSVQKLDSKKVYPSMRAAARALNISKTNISREIQRPANNQLIREIHVETIGKSEFVPTLETLRLRQHLIDPSLPMKMRTFRSPDGKLYETNNLNWFAQVHGLRSSLLSQLSSGHQDSHQQWTRAFGKYDLRLIVPTSLEKIKIEEGLKVFDLKDPGDLIRAYFAQDEGTQVFTATGRQSETPESRLRDYATLHQLQIIYHSTKNN